MVVWVVKVVVLDCKVCLEKLIRDLYLKFVVVYIICLIILYFVGDKV